MKIPAVGALFGALLLSLFALLGVSATPQPDPTEPPSIFPPYQRPMFTWVDVGADVGLLVACIGVVLFMGWYSFLHRWRKNPAGIAIFGVFLGMFLVVLVILFSRIFGGDYFARDYFRFVAYWTLALAIWALLTIAVRGFWRGVTLLNVPERESVKRPPTGPQAVADDLGHDPYPDLDSDRRKTP